MLQQEIWRYERLANELAGMIDERCLRAGERLPSVRTLAADRRLSISTVVQALRELERRGLVEARPQSGYYVRHAAPPALLARPQTLPSVAVPVEVSGRLAGILKAVARPGMLPLAAALPAPELLPLGALNRLYGGVVRRHREILESGAHLPMNSPELIRQLVRRSLAWGGPLDAGEIVVTNSCTEALTLCLRAVTRPGDCVAVESPAYYLMLQLIESLGLKALEIPTDPVHGISIEALDLATRQGGVAACLLVPNASNPLGCVMPDERKRALAELMAARDVAVIEDDIYGDLCYGARRPWPIKAFDTTGNVMLCSSFSKSLSPALRIGFVAAGRRHETLALQKTLSSGASNPVTQRVLAEYLASGSYERQLRFLRRSYENQVVAMQAAIERHFLLPVRMSNPQGGFVLWIELPQEVDTTALLDKALAENLAFVPGEFFSASGMYRNCLRLNCGHPHAAGIEAGIRRLGQLLLTL